MLYILRVVLDASMMCGVGCELVTSVKTRLVLVKLGLGCVVYEGSLLYPAARILQVPSPCSM